MTTTIEGCHHASPCADLLTHARLIAAQPEPLPVGTPAHREWQDARNRVATAAMQTLVERDEKRAAAAVDRISRTTPDSRIRADLTLPAETAAPPPGVPTRAQAGHLVDQMTPELRAEMEAYWARAEPIDTSTTAGKIAVMQAYGAGVPCQTRQRHEGCEWVGECKMIWDWERWDYRIAPPPVARTALQRARDLRSRLDVVDSMAADGILCCLLTDIDYSPVVEVLERRISWDAADLSALPKGRYRLLRDDQ